MTVANNTCMLLTNSGVTYTLRHYGRLALLIDGSGRALTAIGVDGSLRLPDHATIDRLLQKVRLRVVTADGPDLSAHGNDGMRVVAVAHRWFTQATPVDRGATKGVARPTPTDGGRA